MVVIVIKSDVMNIIPSGELVLLRFKKTEKIGFVNHTVSTRLGGVSEVKGLESLNLGSQTADSRDNIIENYRRFCNAADYDINSLVLGKQTHSTNVRYVTYEDAGKGVLKERDYTDVDALITDLKGLTLVIHTADCVPVAFIDTKRNAVGNAHCGWRGTFGLLSQKTIESMHERFGTEPEDLVCTIGPCICQNCYEVSEDLFAQFLDKFSPGKALLIRDGRYFIDLARINRQILLNCGVREENIVISDICTCCNTDYMFSHRGQGPERGILASCLSII